MNNIFTKRFFAWVSIVLFTCLIALGAEYYVLKVTSDKIQQSSEKATLNSSVLTFSQMFIDKVIKADKEVDFDTRLQLENAVRNTKDEEILSKWKAFIDAKTEIEAQSRVKDLLSVLISKIKI